MFDEVLSEETQQMTETIGTIFTIILLSMFCLWLIYICIADIKTSINKKEYIKKLTNDHDKAIILEYEQCKWNLRKRKKHDTSKN